MNLFRAEWRRLFKRRITVGTLLGVVVVLGLVAGGIAISNQKIGPEALAEAEAAAQAEYEEQLRWHEETIDDQVAQCREEQAAAEAAGEPSPWGEGFDCEMLREWVPVREDFQAEWYLPPTFSFRDGFESMIGVFAAILALFGFLVGASFVGAEWRSGGMMNLLLWQPRRLRVLGTKLTTLLLGVLSVGVVLGAAWTGTFWLIATFRGVTDGMTAGVWQSMALTGVRGLMLGLVAATIGFALASIGRHTAMALGAAVAAVIVGVAGVAIVVDLLGVRFGGAWLWPNYARAWLQRSLTFYDWRSCEFSFGRCEPAELVVTWQVAGAGMAALVIVALGLAMWQMRRRDVT